MRRHLYHEELWGTSSPTNISARLTSSKPWGPSKGGNVWGRKWRGVLWCPFCPRRASPKHSGPTKIMSTKSATFTYRRHPLLDTNRNHRSRPPGNGRSDDRRNRAGSAPWWVTLSLETGHGSPPPPLREPFQALFLDNCSLF